MSKQFKHRLLVSTLGFPSLILVIYFSFYPLFKPFFILLTAAFIVIALKEYYQMARQKEFKPPLLLALCTATVYLFGVAFTIDQPAYEEIPNFILLCSLLTFFIYFFKNQNSALGSLATTLFGFAYLVIPLSCILRINYFFPPESSQDGRLWLAYVLIVSKMTDIGGYFFGKCCGKTPLAPLISPKKTVEGSLGGSLMSLLTSIAFPFIFSAESSSFHMTAWQSIWMGILICILAQLGDLAESLLKRDAGVKDSSRLPGLGGFLDVVDSLVFTMPWTYLMLQMRLVG